MKTAVEWLLDWMDKNQYFIGNDLLKAVEEAKEMEMKHLAQAFEGKGIAEENWQTFEEYWEYNI
jgi:hypothetical protein